MNEEIKNTASDEEQDIPREIENEIIALHREIVEVLNKSQTPVTVALLALTETTAFILHEIVVDNLKNGLLYNRPAGS